VAKPSQDIDEDCLDASEANALNLVFAETTIPAPRVRRVVNRKWDYLIVMDYINGRTLAEVWPTFSIWQKISTAFTLRRYLQQLRRLKACHQDRSALMEHGHVNHPCSISSRTFRLICAAVGIFQ
jgi:hypothetical protein